MSNLVFNKIHKNNLIYNTCWEDPRCDRELLDIQSDSQILMITSAGCNALDYALDNPTRIDCVDMNPRQNALLNLKIAGLEAGSPDDMFKMFGEGRHKQVVDYYADALRPSLPDYAKKYWDNNIHFFIGEGIRKSFYHHGTSGLFAWLFIKYLKMQRKQYKLATRLFEAQNLEEQRVVYEELEAKMLNNFVKWAMNQQIVMYLLGVPKSQIKLLTAPIETALNPHNTEGGAISFIQYCMQNVFMNLPIADNYFWQLYFYGKYDRSCVPNYLKPENFDILKKNTTKIKTHNNTITDFLEKNPRTYSHYVLLDHQDWLAENDRIALESEWRAILQNSQSGTKILMRSAAFEVDFFPDFVKEKVVFEQENTQKWHKQDRVGTYGSVYLGIVQ